MIEAIHLQSVVTDIPYFSRLTGSKKFRRAYRFQLYYSGIFQETKSECLKAGAKDADLLSIIGDITIEETQNKLIDETVKKFGKLDVLVSILLLVNLKTLWKATDFVQEYFLELIQLDNGGDFILKRCWIKQAENK